MINFTEDAARQMVQEDPAGPVVMLNLLRFRPDGGELSYRAYLESNAAVWARYGVEPLYAGTGSRPLVASLARTGMPSPWSVTRAGRRFWTWSATRSTLPTSTTAPMR